MGHTISDKDFMIHILHNLPMEYKSKVESLEKDLDNVDYPLTLDRMTDELNFKYEKICKEMNMTQKVASKIRKGKIMQIALF